MNKKLLKFEEDFETIEFKNLRKNLRELPQRGRTSKKIDASRDALRAGKRVSKTGKTYWETRKNRSDAAGTKI